MATTLEILAPYLPYGIEVEMIGGVDDTHEPIGTRGKMTSLSAEYGVLQWQMGGADLWGALVAEVLPVLLPFSALCEPLEDGTIPALVVAKIELNADAEFVRVVPQAEGYSIIEVRSECNLQRDGFLYPEDIQQLSISAAAARYLRSKHFAVGLEPSQFIPKATDSATLEKNPAL